jgi:hypothetical protein
MYPETIADWIANGLGKNETMAVQFKNNVATGGPQVSTKCSAKCRHGLYCSHNFGTKGEQHKCSGGKVSMKDKVLEFLYGNWTYKIEE